MSRLIDADAIVEKISLVMNEPDYQHKGEDWMVGLIMARDAIDEQPTVIPEPKWIPVTERLPDKEEKSYWVCLEGGGQCQCRWTNDMYGLGANEWSEWGWHIMDKPQYSVIVAWMPLPEPYKGVTT